jgi:ribosome biogenesis GTPase
MTGRKLTRRQAWRVQKIQQERAKRAAKRDQTANELLDDSDLGPEREGLITAHFGTQVELVAAEDLDRTTPMRCHLRANLGSLVTGDKVIWREHTGQAIGVVVAVLPRATELARPDANGLLKPIAANIDQIILVFAPHPQPFANLIDRYLIAANALNIPTLLLLNKIDALNEENSEEINELLAIYERLDYPILRVSTKSREGLAELQQQLANKISIFVGQSGVGKSSLINQLLPDIELKVGALSEATLKGRHTTTTAQLFHFPAGGDLVDSPGVREFGLWHMDRSRIFAGFKEFQPLIGQCKFRDCQHESEPGCAVMAAVEAGEIQPARLASYRHIVASLEH